MNVPIIELQDLSKRFTRTLDLSEKIANRFGAKIRQQVVRAVENVNLHVARGEVLGLVGESGCGKSTLGRIVAGTLDPSDGAIIYKGQNLSTLSSVDRKQVALKIQMIFQDPFASLNPRWRVQKIVAEPIRAFGLEADDAATTRRVGELLSVVGLDPRDGFKFPHEFSGGQRQRICIARALASKPDFIVCDEPTSALDVSVQAQILNLMKDLQDEFGLTYLFISHDLSVVRHMANRIGVMYLGRVVEIAEAKMLFKAPKHPYTRMLLDAVPDLEMTGRAHQQIEGEVPNPISPPAGCTFHPRCPFANERCRTEIPAAIERADSLIACHGVEEGRLD